ncbi:MAG: hypothetical protein BWY40_00249 [bacterium ADurb.Bin270]|nr:MAG: hypothetical protein BWY40_00249 [bacterium ADurb.Bin270]
MVMDAKKIEEGKVQTRNLGEEWEGWKGEKREDTSEGKSLFLAIGSFVVLLLDLLIIGFTYMISPRLASWHSFLPLVAWTIVTIVILMTIVWMTQIILTAVTGKNFLFLSNPLKYLFDIVFEGSFKISKFLGISKDRLGNSFVKSYNEMSRATKRHESDEKLLILLPRCLTKEQIKEITSLKERYPIEIHVVSGGELARRKIKESRPTAVIGVACERDLVSGIRDVGRKISLIGIPNKRPDGPCQNTVIEIKELIDAIEFYVGPPSQEEERSEELKWL